MAKGNKLTIAVMFGMVFMVGFVTMFTGPLAAVVKAQFGASNALSQFGSSANFLAYLFMGLPCGMVLKRKGYRFTSLAAVSVGIAGVGLQIQHQRLPDHAELETDPRKDFAATSQDA